MTAASKYAMTARQPATPPMKLHHSARYQPDEGGEPTAVIARLERERAQLVEALRGIALRHKKDGSLCFDRCDHYALKEPSPFCLSYQTILRSLGEGEVS